MSKHKLRPTYLLTLRPQPHVTDPCERCDAR